MVVILLSAALLGKEIIFSIISEFVIKPDKIQKGVNYLH